MTGNSQGGDGMTPQQERDRAYFRAGLREAVAWLHEQADEMGDPKAREILNTAAFCLGVAKADLKPKEPV